MPKKDYFSTLISGNSNKPWFRQPLVRFGLIAVGTVLVIVMVLFNKQLGELLSLFGSKAAQENQATATLSGDSFLDQDYATSPTGSIKYVDGKLRLNF